MGVSSAYRRPSRRARAWSACTCGSANRASTSRCSAASAATASSTAPPWRRTSDRTSRVGQKRTGGNSTMPVPRDLRAPASEGLLGRRGVLLAVARLEPGHAATGVHELLLAGVEGVALAAHVSVDLAGRRGAAGRELGPARAGDQRLVVLRVDVLAHSLSSGGHGRRVVAGGLPTT